VSLSRTLAVTRKTLRSLRHDRRTAAFLVLMPLFMIALFGYTFGGDLKDIKVCVVNLDQGLNGTSAANAVVAGMRGSPTLDIIAYYGPGAANVSQVDATIAKVQKGEAWATVIFARNFTADAAQAISALQHGLQSNSVQVRIEVDSSNPNIADAVLGTVTGVVQTVMVQNYHLIPPIQVSEHRVYGQGAQFIDFFAPGVMGLAAMMVTFMLSIISFVHERSTFTLDRVLTSPITEGEFVGGYALAFGLVGLVQSSVILVTAVLLFNIPIVGSPFLVLLVIFLLAVGMQGLGFLLSSLAKSEFQAIQFLPIILFPSILLAGVFWPLESVPDVLRPISNFIPLTYAVDANRSIMIRGWGIDNVWVQLLILALFAFAMLLLSTWALKRRK